MFATELDTFVQKFNHFWNDRQVAHIDVETCSGKAWGDLRANLGHVPGPLHHRKPNPAFQNQKKGDSPSRQRPHAARAAAPAQVVDAVEASEPVNDEEAVETKGVEETLNKKDTTETVGIEDIVDEVNEN